jgi:hypothetical protein
MALAWGPTAASVLGSRGYKERHVYRVAGCPGYQAMRSLAWQPRAVGVRAISAELAARGGEDGSFRFNGVSVDAAAAVADPELDLPAGDAADGQQMPADGNGAGEAGPSDRQPPNGGAPPAAQDTLSVHAGEKEGRPRVADSLTTPIVQTSTYTFRNTAELIAYQEGRYGSYEYGRYGNPTTRTCEEKIRVLEGAEDCLVRLCLSLCSAWSVSYGLSAPAHVRGEDPRAGGRRGLPGAPAPCLLQPLLAHFSRQPHRA